MKKLYFVGGILSNYRNLLPGAIAHGQSMGLETSILDVVNLVPRWKPYPNPWEQLGLTEKVRVFKDTEALRQFANRVGKPNEPTSQQDIAIFLNLPDREIRWLWDLFESAGFAMGVITLNPVPQIREYSIWQRAMELLVRRPGRRLKGLTKPVPVYWITSGAKTVDCYRRYFRHLRSTRLVKAHSADFETFRSAGHPESNNGDSEEFILFLDQGWHTKLRADFRRDGRYPPTQEDVYRESIVAWLSALQAESGIRVLVSAHPKGGAEQAGRVYPGIEVSSLPTARLVRNARFVIGNATTSLQFAVMAMKPICLFTSDELDKSFMFDSLLGYQRLLDSPVVNIDRPPSAKSVLASLHVDEARYRQFLSDYIVHPQSGSGSLWEKVFHQLTENKHAV